MSAERPDPWSARPDLPAGEPVPVATSTVEPDEKQWWDQPGMPWKHEPTRADMQCIGAIGAVGVFNLAMLPLRGWLLGKNPALLVPLLGSRSGTAAMGALFSQGEAPRLWWLYLLIGSLMSIKFDWLWWWAGKLWGRGMIEVWASQSKRAAKNYGRAERWANKMGWLGMFVAYVPIPLPLMQVIFVLFGSAGMSWKKFMALDFLASTIWLGVYFAFGYAVGDPAVDALKAYAKYANYVAIALVVFIIGSTMVNSSRSKEA